MELSSNYKRDSDGIYRYQYQPTSSKCDRCGGSNEVKQTPDGDFLCQPCWESDSDDNAYDDYNTDIRI